MRNEREFKKTLSPKEAVLFAALKRGRPVRIDTLFKSMWPQGVHGFSNVPAAEAQLARWRQQKVGAVIATLNEKLGRHDRRIAPGRERGTYKLFEAYDRPVTG